MYKLVHFFGTLYTKLLKRKFYHFGKNSIIKPILNSGNEKYISIGDNVNIGTFCRISVSTEFGGIKCKSEKRVRLKIGNNVDIGNNSFISANNDIEIGNNVIMSSYVFISDHDHGFNDFTKPLREQPLSSGGHVKIGDNVFLGIKCSVLKNVTIGKRSIVGANSVVTRNIPAYSIVAGNPAKIVKKYDFEKKSWIKCE
jgi:acetyltransferase-like isoleucine patch superfamily enzyme